VGYASGVTGVDRATVVHGDGRSALRQATLLAGPGELLAVLGPSGSGKSTLLRVIAGLTPLSSGTAVIDGRPVIVPTSERDVAMVFEDTQLIPFMDVAHNLSFSLQLGGTAKEETRSRVAKQALGLRIGKLLPRRPTALSRGEVGRVGIGRALVRAPKAFLLDEPLAHLDAGERSRVRTHIREVVKAAGVTTIYVTHDQTEAMALGDRIAVLNDGRVVQIGTPRELYDAPVDAFVAGFVSSTPLGLLPAGLVVSGGLSGYRVGARLLPTWQPPADAVAARAGGAVLLGIRAEDVHETPAPDHATMTATVHSVERIGASIIVELTVEGTVQAGGAPDTGTSRLYARFDRRSSVRPGQTVTVGVDAARAHVFDPATRRALAHPATESGD
jgi:multiple sugar transport system ATP-binding protein